MSAPESHGRPSLDRPPTVTLLTDFGTRDGFVAAMKGVIADLVPGVRLDDA
ncbi:MAG: SAM-dependent chlorinase/fluorinase, partial [Longimicrobiales bacterium]